MIEARFFWGRAFWLNTIFMKHKYTIDYCKEHFNELSKLEVSELKLIRHKLIKEVLERDPSSKSLEHISYNEQEEMYEVSENLPHWGIKHLEVCSIENNWNQESKSTKQFVLRSIAYIVYGYIDALLTKDVVFFFEELEKKKGGMLYDNRQYKYVFIHDKLIEFTPQELCVYYLFAKHSAVPNLDISSIYSDDSSIKEEISNIYERILKHSNNPSEWSFKGKYCNKQANSLISDINKKLKAQKVNVFYHIHKVEEDKNKKYSRLYIPYFQQIITPETF